MARFFNYAQFQINRTMIKGMYCQKLQYCHKCLKPITMGELKINKFTSYKIQRYYHLDCLEFEQYTPEANLQFRRNLKEESKQQILEKVQELNSAFVPTDKPKTESAPEFLIQSIKVDPSTKRRAYLEVFKYFPGTFIANTLSLVCKELFL